MPRTGISPSTGAATGGAPGSGGLVDGVMTCVASMEGGARGHRARGSGGWSQRPHAVGRRRRGAASIEAARPVDAKSASSRSEAVRGLLDEVVQRVAIASAEPCVVRRRVSGATSRDDRRRGRAGRAPLVRVDLDRGRGRSPGRARAGRGCRPAGRRAATAIEAVALGMAKRRPRRRGGARGGRRSPARRARGALGGASAVAPRPSVGRAGRCRSRRAADGRGSQGADDLEEVAVPRVGGVPVEGLEPSRWNSSARRRVRSRDLASSLWWVCRRRLESVVDRRR